MANRVDHQAILNQYVKDNFTNELTVGSKRVINRLLRLMDDSSLFPINGKFNATNKAINKYNYLCQQAGMEVADCVYSYVETINQLISDIVNDSDNW